MSDFKMEHMKAKYALMVMSSDGGQLLQLAT